MHCGTQETSDTVRLQHSVALPHAPLAYLQCSDKLLLQTFDTLSAWQTATGAEAEWATLLQFARNSTASRLAVHCLSVTQRRGSLWLRYGRSTYRWPANAGSEQ